MEGATGEGEAAVAAGRGAAWARAGGWGGAAGAAWAAGRAAAWAEEGGAAGT